MKDSKLRYWAINIALLIMVAIPACPALFVANERFAAAVLRVDMFDPLDAARNKTVPVGTSLVFARSSTMTDEDTARLAQVFGFRGEDLEKLPQSHPWLVDVSTVMKLNPYPPLLGETHGEPTNAYTYWWASYGYLGVDDRYHQLTWYGGNAVTTPSIFTPKVRGAKSAHGDYFVRYVVHLSRTQEAYSMVTPKDGGAVVYSPLLRRPDIDRIAWNTHDSYDDAPSDQMVFAVFATLPEFVAVALGLLRYRRRRVARG